MSSIIGEAIGKSLRASFIYLFTKLLHFFHWIIIFIKSDFKKTIIATVILIFAILISCFAYSELSQYTRKKNLVKYYKIQFVIDNSANMNIEQIKSEILDNFSGLLKVNLALKIIKKFPENRFNDALEILKYVHSSDNPKDVNDLLAMNILGIEINNNTMNRNIDNIKNIAHSKHRFSVLAMELLAENELSRGLIDSFYRKIDSIQQSGRVKTPYMQNRMNELSFIGYNNKHVQ